MTNALAIESDGNTLVGGTEEVEDPRAVVALLHGIPSVAPPDPTDAGYPGFARAIAERGSSALWVDMRGVRGSGGYFSIEGWVRDAAAIVAAAREIASDVPVLLVGSSAGGAVSAVAAGRGVALDGVALLAAPAHWVSFAAHPEAGMARITTEAGMPLAPEVLDDPSEWAREFDSVVTVDAVSAIDVPLLVLHGTADDVVPVSHAEEIRRAAPRAEVHILEGAAHQLRRDPRAVDVVLDWIDKVTA
ncbi:MAG TPA: alpha/beta fold hydrolase [Actinomycetota bacterium]|nr:alpha/beta fold hydrolase [Actinomycetota bacterium]